MDSCGEAARARRAMLVPTAARTLQAAGTVAAVIVGTGAGRPLRPLTIHLDFGIVEFALLGQAGEVDTRDELVREEKRYRFSEARMEPSTFDTHNCDASRRGASLPRRTWPTSDPVSGRSGCGSGWLIKSRRKPSNSSEERASGKYWELLESEEPPAGVEPATY